MKVEGDPGWSEGKVGEQGRLSTGVVNDGDIDIMVAVERMWRHRVLIVALAAVSLVAAIFYLRSATPTYTAELRVTPSASSQSGLSNQMSRLGGLASLAGLSTGVQSGATPFELYLDALTSREVAAELARDSRIMRTVFAAEWDARENRWKEPRGLTRSLVGAVKNVAGLSTEWQPPDAARLQDRLKRQLEINKDAKEPISSIVYRHPDPAFAVYMLQRLNQAADTKIRRTALQQASRYAHYLSRRLPSINVAEHRSALVESLAEQERSIMMTSADVPYAAVTLEAPTASPRPTSPDATATLILTALGALLIGCAIAMLDPAALRSRQRASENPG